MEQEPNDEGLEGLEKALNEAHKKYERDIAAARELKSSAIRKYEGALREILNTRSKPLPVQPSQNEKCTLEGLAQRFNLNVNNLRSQLYRLPREKFNQYSVLEPFNGKTRRYFLADILGVLGTKGNQAYAEPVEEVKLVSKTDAMQMLRYSTDSALYSNKLLETKKQNGRIYVTQESLDEFFAQHKRKGKRWVPRKYSVTQKQSRGEPERPVQLTKQEQRILREYNDGKAVKEIAKDVKLSRADINKKLRFMGIYDKQYVSENFPKLEAVQKTAIPGVKSYPKDEVRFAMLETFVDRFCDGRPIKYLGLEGPHFCSYIRFAEVAAEQLDPSKSLIAEKDQRSYHAMKSFVDHHDAIKGGEIFKGLNIRYGELSNVLSEVKKDFKFNFINLDYEGHINGKKIYALRTLFDGMLEQEALLFITLGDSPWLQKRLNGNRKELGKEFFNGFGTTDQNKIVDDELGKLCEKHQYGFEQLRAERYTSRKENMLTLAYRVYKK